MDFGFNEEQDLLRAQARDFLDRESTSQKVRALMDGETGYDPALEGRLAELGWTALPFPEENGGLGLGMVDLVVVLEEMGRHVTPSALMSTVGMAGMAVLTAGTAEQRGARLPGICDGSQHAALALAEATGRWDAAGVNLRAERTSSGYVLRGEKTFVPDGHVADWLVVAVRTGDEPGDGVTLLLVDTAADGVSRRRLKVMDRTRPVAAVSFEDVEVGDAAVLGEPGRGWRSLQGAIDRALVAISAEACGVMARVLEMSVEYAKSRQQFGRPIGAYQAVSHRCADMLVAVESAKSLTYHAAWAVDEAVPEASLAAAMCKAYISEMAPRVAGDGIQVHGGIGFTWEHDMHLYFKRAKWAETVLGDAAHHRARVADLLEL